MGIPYCEPTDEKQIKVLSFRNYLHAFDFFSPAKNAIILKLVTTHQLTDTELNFNSIRVVLPRCRRSHRHLGCHPRSKGETDPTTTLNFSEFVFLQVSVYRLTDVDFTD